MTTPTDEQVKDLGTSISDMMHGSMYDDEVTALRSLPNTITEWEVVADNKIETIKINWGFTTVSIEKVSTAIKNNPFNLCPVKPTNLIYWKEEPVGSEETDKKTILRGVWKYGAIKGMKYEKEVGIRIRLLQRVFYIFSEDSDLFPDPIYYMGAYDAPAHTAHFEAIWETYYKAKILKISHPFVISFIQQFLEKMSIEDYNTHIGIKDKAAILINWNPLFHRLSEKLGTIEWLDYLDNDFGVDELEQVSAEMRNFIDAWIEYNIGELFTQEGPDEYGDEGGWSMGSNWEKKLSLALLENNIVKRFVKQVVLFELQQTEEKIYDHILYDFLLSDCMVWVFALQLDMEDSISEHLFNYVE